ncbi:MAG TPA: hypothetical protein VK428_04835 [Acidimicrobiales bacterium]|nr:hypothetical protein [Acidimicrobiales bacterium]
MENTETPRNTLLSKRVRSFLTVALASVALSIPAAATAASAQPSHGDSHGVSQGHSDGGRVTTDFSNRVG